jgi:hypothetical protein
LCASRFGKRQKYARISGRQNRISGATAFSCPVVQPSKPVARLAALDFQEAGNPSLPHRKNIAHLKISITMNLLKFVLIAAMALSVSGFFPAAAQQPAETLSGEWKVTLRHRGFGELRLLLDIETLPDGAFVAYSHRKGVKHLMGGFKASAGKMFGPKSNQMLQTGALCRIENGRYTADTGALLSAAYSTRRWPKWT